MREPMHNYLSQANPAVVEFGTRKTKYLYVEGKSDKNIMARIILAHQNGVIIKSVSDEPILREHYFPEIEKVRRAKNRVTRMCSRRLVHGFIDRDGDNPEEFPPRCISTDFRDLESTMFHYGGVQYIGDLIKSLVSPITPLPDMIIDSFNQRLERLSSTLDRYFFPDGESWTSYGAICIQLDKQQSQLPIGSTDEDILEAIGTAYGKPLDGLPVGITPICEVNGHIIVAVFAVLLRLDQLIRDHLIQDQMDVQFLDHRYEVLKKQLEKAIQISVPPPVKDASMTTRIILDLGLTKTPDWL